MVDTFSECHARGLKEARPYISSGGILTSWPSDPETARIRQWTASWFMSHRCRSLTRGRGCLLHTSASSHPKRTALDKMRAVLHNLFVRSARNRLWPEMVNNQGYACATRPTRHRRLFTCSLMAPPITTFHSKPLSDFDLDLTILPILSIATILLFTGLGPVSMANRTVKSVLLREYQWSSHGRIPIDHVHVFTQTPSLYSPAI